MAKKKGRGRPPKNEGPSELISFRLTPELVKKLKGMARGEVDVTGAQISAPAYARRIVINHLTKE